MDETKLIEKLRMVEALFAGAATEGEKFAAECARGRILERLKSCEKEAPPIEYHFSMSDMWTRKVFVALLRRYGILPYRYSGQRYTTVMAKVSKPFVDETLWPEFEKISDTLRDYLSEVTDRVVHQVIHADSSEAEVVEKTKELSHNGDHNTESAPDTGPKTSPPPTTTNVQNERAPEQETVDNTEKKRARNKLKKKKKRKRR